MITYGEWGNIKESLIRHKRGIHLGDRELFGWFSQQKELIINGFLFRCKKTNLAGKPEMGRIGKSKDREIN